MSEFEGDGWSLGYPPYAPLHWPKTPMKPRISAGPSPDRSGDQLAGGVRAGAVTQPLPMAAVSCCMCRDIKHLHAAGT